MLLLLLMAKARMVSVDGGTIILVENEKACLSLSLRVSNLQWQLHDPSIG